MVDVQAGREAYENFDMDNVGWISLEHNTADGLTKVGICVPLDVFLDGGRLNIHVKQWYIRSGFDDSNSQTGTKDDNCGQ